MTTVTTEEANEALLKASRKMVLEEDGLVSVAAQDLQEVIFSLMEKAQMLAETLAKSGNTNAAWLHKKLHEVTEEFDLMEVSQSEEETYEKDYQPDIGRGELLDVDEAVQAGATVFGGNYKDSVEGEAV